MAQATSGSVLLQTSQGPVLIELYWKHAPRTCNNFYQLAKTGYYNGVPFHRIIDGFMIQGGDPTGTGRGGSSIYGGKFEDEITNELRFVGAGILAMANSGPNTNGSQFFVTLAPTPHLDQKHTIFGRVQEGMKVIQRIGLVAVDADDKYVSSRNPFHPDGIGRLTFFTSISADRAKRSRSSRRQLFRMILDKHKAAINSEKAVCVLWLGLLEEQIWEVTASRVPCRGELHYMPTTCELDVLSELLSYMRPPFGRRCRLSPKRILQRGRKPRIKKPCERGRNAVSVPQRADRYRLGCGRRLVNVVECWNMSVSLTRELFSSLLSASGLRGRMRDAREGRKVERGKIEK